MRARDKFESFLVTSPNQLHRIILPLFVLGLTLGLTYTLWEDARKSDQILRRFLNLTLTKDFLESLINKARRSLSSF